jgi:hypothetical protein
MNFPRLLLLSALCVLAVPALADQRDIDSDPSTDFSSYHTFLIRPGQVTARAPELNSPLTRRKIDEGLRAVLTGKKLSEVASQPDLVVVWRFGSVNKQEVQTWVTGRWGRGRAYSTYRFTEGTLVVDLYERGDRQLVWRGIYRDDESNPSKLSNRLDDDIKKLFKDFPPKKK